MCFKGEDPKMRTPERTGSRCSISRDSPDQIFPGSTIITQKIKGIFICPTEIANFSKNTGGNENPTDRSEFEWCSYLGHVPPIFLAPRTPPSCILPCLSSEERKPTAQLRSMSKRNWGSLATLWWFGLFVIGTSVEGFASCAVSGQLAPRVSIEHKSVSLSALPPSLPWVVAHVIMGASGAPIVVQATRSGGWYRRIDLPLWTPPDNVFAPVWTTLYALMGVAMSQIFQLPPSAIRTLALSLWAVHMVLNLAWAPVFFGIQRLRMGLMLNVGLLATLGGVILPAFYHLNPPSAYLLLPYTFWLSFATCLNAAICRRNPTRGGYNDAKFQVQLAALQRKAQTYAGL